MHHLPNAQHDQRHGEEDIDGKHNAPKPQRSICCDHDPSADEPRGGGEQGETREKQGVRRAERERNMKRRQFLSF